MTSRVSSFELLSTTSTSHFVESGSARAAALSRAFARLSQRLYVQRITVIFMAVLRSHRIRVDAFDSTYVANNAVREQPSFLGSPLSKPILEGFGASGRADRFFLQVSSAPVRDNARKQPPEIEVP